MSKKPYTVIAVGEDCPKCRKPMERRTHKKLRSKQINAPYYFSEWDCCRPCKHIQHYEHFKVENDNEANRDLHRYLETRTERQQQLAFIKSI